MVLDIVQPLCDLHFKYKLVHCNIQPRNIEIDINGRFKLINFAKAVVLPIGAQVNNYLFPSLTLSHGVNYINPTYSPPEFFKNDISNPGYSNPQHPEKGDLWSLGVTILECLNNNHPFKNSSISDFMNVQIKPKITPFIADYYCEIEPFLNSCLEKQVDQRCSYFGAMSSNYYLTCEDKKYKDREESERFFRMLMLKEYDNRFGLR